MKSILRLIDEHTAIGRHFAIIIQILIVASIVAFTLETLPDLSTKWQHAFDVFELVVVVIFTAEYLLRLIASKSRLRYIFSFYGLIDLAAIAPFYLATGLDLRSLRVLRIFRLLRIAKLFRYSRAAQRLATAFFDVRHELILFGFMIVVLLYLASVGIYYFENAAQPDQFKSILHSMWWAVTTLTTVGYGDIYPVTLGGRIFTFVILVLGLGVVAVPTGLVASALTEKRDDDDISETPDPLEPDIKK